MEVLRIKVLGVVKISKKRLPKACPLGEADVVGVRRSERFDIDRVQHQRPDEDLKEGPAQLEEVGPGQRFVAEDDVKDVLEGHAEVLRFSSFVGITSEMALTRKSEW